MVDRLRSGAFLSLSLLSREDLDRAATLSPELLLSAAVDRVAMDRLDFLRLGGCGLRSARDREYSSL